MLLSSPVIFEGRQKQKRKRLLLGGKRKKKKNRNPNQMPARGSYEEYMSIRPGLSHNPDS